MGSTQKVSLTFPLFPSQRLYKLSCRHSEGSLLKELEFPLSLMLQVPPPLRSISKESTKVNQAHVLSVLMSMYLSFKYFIIYLKGRVYSPNGHNSDGRARQKPGAWNYIQVYHTVAMGPKTQGIFPCFPLAQQ